jgi:aminopeptidase N
MPQEIAHTRPRGHVVIRPAHATFARQTGHVFRSSNRKVSAMRPAIIRLLPILCAIAVSHPAAAAEARPGRLPPGVTPVHYQIRIEPDAHALRFAGSAAIDVDVQDATQLITLNTADLDIASAELDGVRAAGIELDAAGQVARLRFAEPVAPGRHRLTIDYAGRIYTSAMGLFAVDYDTAAGRRRMLTTQFEVADGRRFAPMWDEPAAKATFDLEVVLPAGQSAYSNMPVAETRTEGDRQRVRFATSPQMSSYLLHLTVGELERISRTVAGVDVGVVTRKGAAESGRYALEAAVRILPWFNDYFGTPYPLPKLDMIAVPGSSQFFGAMENWGAIMYFEPVLLVDPRLSSTSDRQTVFAVVAHEVAHQWFGNLVTMEWWDDLWLNEGFAAWMGGKVEAALRPESEPALLFVNDVREPALRRDASPATHPVVQPVSSIAAANQAFDVISYSKGRAVLRMIEDALGEAGFRDGIRRYMGRHAYGNAVTDRLWAELAAATGLPVTEIAHDFTLQPGVPLVTVQTAGCVDGRTSVTLSQSRFETGPRDPHRYAWRIPVRIQSVGTGVVTTVTLGKDGAPATAAVPGCGAIAVNTGQAGYFRTKYAEHDLQRLRGAFDSLADVDRLGLLHDTWALGEAGELPATQYLELAGAVAADANPLIVIQQARTLASIDHLFKGSAEQAGWRAFARARLQPAFVRVGWLPASGEADNVALLREELIRALGSLEDAAVLAEARERFASAAKAPYALPAAIRRPVLDVVAQNADAGTWEAIRRRAAAATDPVEKQQLWRALGAARDPGLASRALRLALSADAPQEFAVALIAQVSIEHPERAFEFAVANEGALLALVEAASRETFIPSLASTSADAAMIARVREYAERSLPTDARQAAEQSMADIRFRAEAAARQRPLLERWVRAR